MEGGGRVEGVDGGGVKDARWERSGYVASHGEGDGLGVVAGFEGVAAGGTGGEFTVVAGGVDAAVSEGDVESEEPRFLRFAYGGDG